MGRSKSNWDISNKPSTRSKLKILKSYFNVWTTIWNKQSWASNEWYIFDLFAGRGNYIDNKHIVYGSPLIFLETLANKRNKFNSNLKIKLYFVEKNRENFKALKKNVGKFVEDNFLLRDLIEVNYYNNDCNKVIDEIISRIKDSDKCPLFVLMDPSGLQIKKVTVKKIVNLRNRKDILFNFILEGVRRAGGIAKKAHSGKELNIKEIKTVQTLTEFIGDDINIINTSDIKILEDYVKSIFTTQNLKVVAYDMKYPNREDILYYLLFASRKPSITDIVRDIYAKQKEDSNGETLFGKEFYKDKIITISPKNNEIRRKTLLYKTKVEYGNWTINHIEGCMHGCKFPCYAFMMSKKFGRVKNYDDWRKPRIVANALELLENEMQKYKNQIDFVHLSFMTDPFMYDYENKELIPEIKNLTLEIIERLNEENIRVTTLTKGFYPSEIPDSKLLDKNEYGITLVSLSDEFKRMFEPFSASYQERIDSLKRLHEAGLKTWVSIEPYPTPNLDETAEHIETILEKISFVDKIIFGKLNYNVTSSRFKKNGIFYEDIAKRVIKFCTINNIRYHIKIGTPFSKNRTKNIFKP